MEITENEYWVFFRRHPEEGEQPLIEELTGKWMHFFTDPASDDKLCRTAIAEKIVLSCKRSNHFKGVTCFYLNINDYDSHKKLLLFMKAHHLFQTHHGVLPNASFKLDAQTLLNQYGGEYQRLLTLSDFFDLHTQEWIATEESFAEKMDSISDIIQDLNEQLSTRLPESPPESPLSSHIQPSDTSSPPSASPAETQK